MTEQEMREQIWLALWPLHHKDRAEYAYVMGSRQPQICYEICKCGEVVPCLTERIVLGKATYDVI